MSRTELVVSAGAMTVFSVHHDRGIFLRADEGDRMRRFAAMLPEAGETQAPGFLPISSIARHG